MGKKIVSYSLWGQNPTYINGLIANIELINRFYPDWVVNVYSTPETYETLKKHQYRSNVPVRLIIRKPINGEWEGAFWRYDCISELEDGDLVIFRDADSRISEREVAAVTQWIESTAAVHLMRDHPWHTARMMGGMWGTRKLPPDITRQFASLYTPKQGTSYNKGDDQMFLDSWIYPHIKHDTFVHASYNKYEPHAKDFPTERDVCKSFVGEVFEADGTPHQHDRDMI